MELTGCCFALDVPPAWRMETNDGVVIATSDESFAGFIPNVVLRESRLRRPEPTSLAAASQANLAVLSTQIPGSFFFHVEALPDANAAPGPAERRRLWAFSTLKIPEAHGNALCLVMIQDLLVVGDVIAEVTATVPLMAWHRGSVYESILDSLRPLPPRARRKKTKTRSPGTPSVPCHPRLAGSPTPTRTSSRSILTTGPATATAFPGRNWTSSRIPFRRWPGRSLTCRRMPSRFSTT